MAEIKHLLFLHLFKYLGETELMAMEGVLLHIIAHFLFQEIILDTPCEVVACKLKLSDLQSLVIVAIYRPPSSNYEYVPRILM